MITKKHQDRLHQLKCRIFDFKYGFSHHYIVDLIDLDLDKSQRIVYCKKCLQESKDFSSIPTTRSK